MSESTPDSKAMPEPMAETVNIEQLRHELKEKWLSYYCENREWLVQLSIWVTDGGAHRPSASFILATLTALEPSLTRLMPLLSGLNSSPDRIVSALGLNFNPDDVVEHWLQEKQKASQTVLLPSNTADLDVAFHPEAMLMRPTMTIEPSAQHHPPSLNGHHHTTQTISHVTEGDTSNTFAEGMATPSASLDLQQIALKDEQCAGRDRTYPDNIWR